MAQPITLMSILFFGGYILTGQDDFCSYYSSSCMRYEAKDQWSIQHNGSADKERSCWALLSFLIWYIVAAGSGPHVPTAIAGRWSLIFERPLWLHSKMSFARLLAVKKAIVRCGWLAENEVSKTSGKNWEVNWSGLLLYDSIILLL